MSSMNLIIDNLWLGDMVGAHNKFLLKKNGITHILTVAQGILPKFPTMFQYKLINILDCPTANLKQHFQSCIKFIKDAILSGGCVLVHCFAGVSRSATIVIAYLMQELGMTMKEAMQHTKKARYFINPNDGFRRQLLQFQRDLINRRKAQAATSQDQPLSQEEKKVETMIRDPMSTKTPAEVRQPDMRQADRITPFEGQKGVGMIKGNAIGTLQQQSLTSEQPLQQLKLFSQTESNNNKQNGYSPFRFDSKQVIRENPRTQSSVGANRVTYGSPQPIKGGKFVDSTQTVTTKLGSKFVQKGPSPYLQGPPGLINGKLGSSLKAGRVYAQPNPTQLNLKQQTIGIRQ